MNKFFKFKYVNVDHVKELGAIEPKLAQFISVKKPFSIRIMPDHFHCLVHTVISQQLSNAAVDTIGNRLVLNIKKITPKTISEASKELLAVVGLSPQKIHLLKQISFDILDKKLNLKKLEKLSNAEIAMVLKRYKYVGQGTVDMLLIFTYYRNNILPRTDFGVVQSIKKIYELSVVTEEFMVDLENKLGEYATLFTFCMGTIGKSN